VKRRWLAEEVVQTSNMDCGPAALKCLLEGFGIRASYGRLREACQTDVDGTSIDTLEEIANQLGLAAEQVMVPPDHLCIPGQELLPAIAVVRLPGGILHFWVLWRRHGRFVQVMDPALGRRWLSLNAVLSRLHSHQMPVSADDWRAFAGSADFVNPLRRRLARVSSDAQVEAALQTALADPGFSTLAALDASARMIQALVDARALSRHDAEAALIALFRDVQAGRDQELIPSPYWSVRPQEDGQLRLSGAVLLHVLGKRDRERAAPPQRAEPEKLPPELEAALSEPSSRPVAELLGLLRKDGLLAPTALFYALGLSAGGKVFEAVLWLGLFELGGMLRLRHEQVTAMIAFMIFLLTMLALEFSMLRLAAGLGRRLEARLRITFFSKIPRLGDRYFSSRPISDMASRSHDLHAISRLPQLGQRLLEAITQLVLTALALAWLDTDIAALAMIASLAAIALPLLLQKPLSEHDLRLRTHAAALSSFYLDALRGLIPVRAHGAGSTVRREQESLLVNWMDTARALARVATATDALQASIGFGLAIWMLERHLSHGHDVGGTLLALYWVLSIPVLGQEIALLFRQYPTLKNVILRVLEPLGAREDVEASKEAPLTQNMAPPFRSATGIAVAYEAVNVLAGGQCILEDINVAIKPGTHIAMVGPSGAGKSCMVGILLGWHRPASGRILVDERPLHGTGLAHLRQETAWVDPAVQLWNRTLLNNLTYGADSSLKSLQKVIALGDLRHLLERLPEGLQTSVGESGALLSGGEGQRVRLGRAVTRKRARLVILDEPFRGLDRHTRHELLLRVRSHWRNSTLLFVSHDIGETQSFDQVLVVEGGRVVEKGAPSMLLKSASRYRSMLEAEEAVRRKLWSASRFRRLRLDNGRILEESV
jgi:ABC-type bacteriocin/lantibiotic exporter with double-glycine peptidase domain